jgi:hypothetical protein
LDKIRRFLTPKQKLTLFQSSMDALLPTQQSTLVPKRPSKENEKRVNGGGRSRRISFSL